jgi:CheY-like chemotaxis protein
MEEDIAFDIDPLKMTHVLRNLFSNAIKFTPSGGFIKMIIEIISDPIVGREVLITVKDSGVGLSPENLRHLFEEGVQFNANALQEGGGSGFGLYITKGIVNLHKGASIWADSAGNGEGCAFHIKLPLSLTPFYSMKYLRSSVEDSDLILVPEAVGTKSLLILVVDDSKSNRKMMIRMLQIAGHTAVQAEDGLAAVREISLMLMKRQKGDILYTQYDAILMDSEMPNMCGPEATREMRALGYSGPIIGVTGNEDHTDFNEAGADLVLMKPVNLASVKRALTISTTNMKTATISRVTPIGINICIFVCIYEYMYKYINMYIYK